MHNAAPTSSTGLVLQRLGLSVFTADHEDPWQPAGTEGDPKGPRIAAETLQLSMPLAEDQEPPGSLGAVQENLRCGVAERAKGPDLDGTIGPGQAGVL